MAYRRAFLVAVTALLAALIWGFGPRREDIARRYRRWQADIRSWEYAERWVAGQLVHTHRRHLIQKYSKSPVLLAGYCAIKQASLMRRANEKERAGWRNG